MFVFPRFFLVLVPNLLLLLYCSTLAAFASATETVALKAVDNQNVRQRRTVAKSKDAVAVRRVLKKKDTLLICHFPPEDPTSYSTIEIDAKQFSLHKNHGDLVGGTCEELCGPVDTFEKLEAAIKSTALKNFKGKRIVTVCPGTISVPSTMELSLDYPVQVQCAVARTCVFVGEARGYGFIMLTKGTLTLSGMVVSTLGDLPFDTQLMPKGAITVANSKLNIVNCLFESNEMSNGAIYADVSSVSIGGSSFYGNSCLIGCAVNAQYSSGITIMDSMFENNAGEVAGVMLLAYGSSATIGNSTFIGNSAQSAGGAVLSDSYTTLYLKKGCVFKNNQGAYGGAIFGKVVFAKDANPQFANNQASYACNDIYDDTGSCLP